MDRAFVQLRRTEGGIAVLLLRERSSGQRKSQLEVREFCFHDGKNPESIATAQTDGLKNQQGSTIGLWSHSEINRGHRERGRKI